MTQDPRLGSYSKWLIANKDKKDTPEWQKVSDVYKSIRANAAPAQPTQVPTQTTGDTSIGTAFAVADAQAESAATSGMASLSRNLEDSFLADVQRTGREKFANPVREFIGLDPLDTDAINKAATQKFETAASLSAEAAQKLQDDLNFRNLTTKDINSLPSFLNYVTQKTAQAAPYMGVALASGGTLTYPFSVGEISQSLQEIDGLPQNQKDNIAATGGLIMTALENLGIAKLLPDGISTSILGGMAKGFISEGSTEGLQELVVIGSEAIAGKKFSEGEILDRLKEGVAAGGAVGSSFKGTTSLYSKAKEAVLKDVEASDPQAASDIARQLKQIAEAEGFNLKNTDVSAQMGAKGALEAVRETNNGEITELVKTLKPLLNSKDAESLDQMVNDFAPANAAIKSGKNKVSGYVTKSQMQALSRLVAPYQEGQALMNALAKSNTITGLFKDGMKGGISQFTDYFSPFGSSGAVYDPTRMGNIIIGGGMAGVTQGTSIPLQAGVVGLGRLVDAATGRRNRLSNFVNKNLYKDGLPTPKGESLIEKAQNAELKEAQLVEESNARREAIAAVSKEINAPPKDNSPIGTILSGTGLDQNGLVEVIEQMSQDHANKPELIPVLDSIKQNLEGGKNPVLELNEIVPVIGQFAQANRPELIVARPDNELLARTYNPPAQTEAQTQGPAQPQAPQQSGNQSTTPENYQAGQDDNNTFVRNLESKLADDTTLAPLDKAQLATALADMQLSLGPNPVEAMTEMVEDLGNMGVPQEAIETYVKPYADRVIKQQDRAARLAAPVEREVAPEFQEQSPVNPELVAKAPQQFLPQQARDLTPDYKSSVIFSDSEPLSKQLKDLTAETRANELQDDLYTKAVRVVTVDGTVAPSYLQRKLGIGLNKAAELVFQMEQEGFVSPANHVGKREVDPELARERLDELEAPVDPESNMELDQDPLINLPSAPALQDVVPTGTNTNVPMETAVTRSSNMARSKVYAKGRDLKLDIQRASLKAQKANNVNLQEMTPENAVRLADFAVFDALEAIKTNQNAIGWYEGTIDQMVDNLSQVVPEIKTNQPNRLQFLWALAVTSNGLVVDKNLNLAVAVYEHLQKTGRFPAKMGIGTAAQGINEGLAKYHKMIDKFDGDHQALEDFMLKKMRSGDIEGIVGIKPTGEGENAIVRGAAVLGAKIGNGFFSNLYGEYDALTMDRWLMRTVGRWRGNLVKKNKPMERQKRDELWNYLTGLDDTQLARLKKLYKGTGTKISNKTMSDAALDKLSVATAKLSMKPEWRDLINPEFKDVRLIGNGLAGYLDGQVEAPAGPSERQHIRDIFQKGLEDLNNNPEVRKLSNKPLTMADFQALLWYQEKLLYDTAKKPIGEQNKEYKDEEAPDYANAAQKLVTRRAIERDRLGSSGSTSRRGGGPSASNDVQRGQSVSKGALELDQDAPALARATNGGRSTDDLRQDGRSQEEGTQRLPALALQNTPREPQLVSSLNELGNADILNDFLARPGWSILTATQENLSPTIKDKRNQENNADLEKQLQDQNIPYLPVSGAYKGVDQGPSFLILTDEPAAMALGRKHLQESILTNNGLVYTKRTQPNTLPTQQNEFGPQAQQEDFYSTVSGLPFSMGLDLKTGPGNPVFKPGFVEAQNRPQLPVRVSDGLVELHHWSSKQLKSIDPKKAGTGPYSGAERRRSAKLGFFGINPRQNLREQGTGYVKEPSLGGYEHIALVDPNDLYPIIEDPDGILADIGSDISDLEKAIKDAGYKGYYTTDDGSGRAPLGNVAALFDPIEVSEVKSKPQEELDQSIPALSNFLRNGAAKLRARIAPRPTSQQVKSQAPVARALFEIGKKGSQFENGITNIDDALKLAKALSITVNMFHDQQQMAEAAGYTENKPGIRGVFVKTPGGSSGEVFALEPGTETGRGPISDIDALTTVLHEIFHGVGAGPMSGSRMSGIALPVDVGRAMAKSPENAMRRMIKKPQGKRTNQERKIMHEIKRLQNQIGVYAEANPKERRSVRLLTASMDAFAEKRGSMSPELQLEVEQDISNYEQYIRKTSEFTVDPLWVYAFNPKLAKAVMPETTKWIRENLKAAGNPNIQFYSHPLAMTVAVVAAILAQQEAAEEEEDQQRQMMPPGALSPQMGALSAA
jgi:hypothetical protein